jgi:thymidylate kinase
LALWLRPPVGWVGLIGPDGTGKSTVTAGVQAKLSRVYSGSVAAHWRPGILGGTTAADDTAAVRQPHASAPRGSMVSVVKLAFLALDWACGDALLLRPARAAGRLILFDRHFVDILVDPRRYRYGGPRWLASLVAKLVPSPEIWIVLDGDPELIHARKDEVSPTELARLRAEYRGLAAKLRNAHVVDVGATIDEVVCRVAELILVSASRATEGDRHQGGRVSRPA